MERLVVFNSENVVSTDKPKGKDGGTGSTVEVAGRKKLGEITNLPCPPKLSSHFEKMQTVSLPAKDIIQQLQNENMALKKVLADRNKLIESSRIELHNLRSNLEKLKLQNSQLAQANSQLLQVPVSLLLSNTSSLKALKHELGCRNGLRKALQLEADAADSSNEVVPAQPDNGKKDKARDQFGSSDHNEYTALSVDSLKKRRQSIRLKCDDSKTGKDVFVKDEAEVPISSVTADPACESSGTLDQSVMKVGAKKKADNQEYSMNISDDSACLRRRSMRFKFDATQTSETKNVQMMATAETPRDADSDVLKLVKEENVEDSLLTTKSQVSHRHSVGRPQRHAAVKIHSYTEVPINAKLRRPE
ncbi:hypothetical protein QQ045_021662 [Rhodiola kirilowii]